MISLFISLNVVFRYQDLYEVCCSRAEQKRELVLLWLIVRMKIYAIRLNKTSFRGPSIIFKRYNKTAKSFIRATPQKPCGRFFGLDANALYLYCIGKELPLGAFVRRHLNDTYKPRKRDKYTFAYDWPAVGNTANTEGVVWKVCVDLYKNLIPPEAIFLWLKHNSIYVYSRQTSFVELVQLLRKLIHECRKNEKVP